MTAAKGADAVPPREALVLRFPPGGADPPRKLRYEAKVQHRRHAEELGLNPLDAPDWYRLSVFVTAPEAGEREADTLRRLIKVATHAGIDVADPRNAGFWVANVGDIVDAGFPLVKDLYPGEPLEHYSVDVGPGEPTNERIQALMTLFDGPRSTQEASR